MLCKMKLCEKLSIQDEEKLNTQDGKKLNNPQIEVPDRPLYVKEFVTETIKRATKPLATEQSSLRKTESRKSRIPRKLKSPVVHSI